MNQSSVARAAAAPDAEVAATPGLSIGPAPFVPTGSVGTLRPSRHGVALRRLLRTPSALVGLLIVLFWIACAILWPLVAPYSPNAQDYNALLTGPSPAHPLGTDQFGRDVLSRVLAGSREVLVLAPAATLLGLLGGMVVGLATAYYRGWFDEIVMRVMDAIMAFPIIVLSLLVLALLGPSRLNVILVIAFTYVPLTGRVVRAAALTVRDLDYVAAARLRGASGIAIMLTEIMPNIGGPIIVEGTVRVGYAVFAAASLSFIGLGIQPPSPDWGAMINDTHLYVQNDPVIVLAPTLAIASLVVAINLLADGLRQAVRA
jgi:peptide/nickel transport system permease protein